MTEEDGRDSFPVGKCGEDVGDGAPCVLAPGHDGWHRDMRGMEWDSHIVPNALTKVIEERTEARRERDEARRERDELVRRLSEFQEVERERDRLRADLILRDQALVLFRSVLDKIEPPS